MVDQGRLDKPVPARRLPYTRRQILTQILVAAVILVSGVAIGTGGTILLLKDKIVWRALPPPPMGQFDPNGLIDRWRTELTLTGDQARQIKEMFTKHLVAARTRFQEIAQREQAERKEFAASMKEILTPDQFAKWEHEFTEREKHFRRWRPGGPGGPGGPGRSGRPGRPEGSRRPEWRDGTDGPNRPDGRPSRGFRPMRGPEPGPNHPPEPQHD